MKPYLLISFLFLGHSAMVTAQTAESILARIDANMSAKNQIVESTIIIHGQRNSRTMVARSYTVGSKNSFTEYLSPAREKGIKMLKLDDKLWTYYPDNDRTIQISGHMLRQSVMGSDLSYEDMMEDQKLADLYTAVLGEPQTIDGRKVYMLELTAKSQNVAYYSRKIWVDMDRYVPLQEELYGKSGKLLKRSWLSDIKLLEGRWYPMKVRYKDMLQSGKGTEMIINSVKFNQSIPEYIFTKGALKK